MNSGYSFKIKTSRVRLNLFLDMHFNRAQTTRKVSFTKNTGRWRLLLQNKASIPNTETNCSKHWLWNSTLIPPKQIRKDWLQWSRICDQKPSLNSPARDHNSVLRSKWRLWMKCASKKFGRSTFWGQLESDYDRTPWPNRLMRKHPIEAAAIFFLGVLLGMIGTLVALLVLWKYLSLM